MTRPGAGPERRRKGWRIVRIASGSALLALGVVGLVMPILQGWALILGGLAVLSRDVPWARRWLERLRDWARRLRRSARTARKSGASESPATEDRDASGGNPAG